MNNNKKIFKNTQKGLLEAEMYMYKQEISITNMSPETLLYTANKTYFDSEVE